MRPKLNKFIVPLFKPIKFIIGKNKLLLFLLFTISTTCYAQNKLTGRIVDDKTKQALAFVNIVYNSSNQGTTTDLDGYFIINSKEKIEFLNISYLGYESKQITLQEIKSLNYIEITLKENAYQLSEVTVLPGENPAHRIINLVIENSKKNNPEKMRSFSYTAYNKMYFTFDTKNLDMLSKDTVKTEKDSVSKDDTTSNTKSLKQFFDEQHLFITESVTERKFKFPDNNHEEVIAHRMSGLKTPAFSLLTTQFQSFSFYKDYINLMDKKYLSPISKGSTRKYFFLIKDTMYNEAEDTIFIISYRPLKGKNFDGLQGVLHINSNGYAVQSVNAKPYKPKGMFNVNIQQKYELIDSVQWFPVQLNTDLIMNIMEMNQNDQFVIEVGEGNKDSQESNYIPLIGVGKSYLSDISLNPEFKRKDFKQNGVVVGNEAIKKDSVFWNKYRKDTLSMKDIRTYEVIDSLGEAENFDKFMDIIEIIASGQIPIKFINIDPTSILWYNSYEGYRLGLGLSTNNRLLHWLSVGGYVGYGFRDKALKYSGHLEFILNKEATQKIKFGMKKGLEFSDEYHFFNEYQSLNLESGREFFLSEMDSIESYYGSFKFRVFRYLQTELLFNYQHKNIINPYRYNCITPTPKQFTTSELSLHFRYAYKEKFLQTPKGNLLSMGTRYPILYANIIKSSTALNSDYEYLKVETKLTKKFPIRHLGDLNLTITGAYLFGDIPYSEMYYGMGSYSWLNIDNSFNTMRVNEFISDKFVSVFIKHDFGSLLFKTKKWEPKIAITSSAGWGDVSRIHTLNPWVYPQPLNKGYFESGIQINQIFKLSYQAYGIGIYYRYGAYSRPKQIENWAFKFNLTFAL